MACVCLPLPQDEIEVAGRFETESVIVPMMFEKGDEEIEGGHEGTEGREVGGGCRGG